MILLILACHATDPEPDGTPPGADPLLASTLAFGDPAAPASALATLHFARPMAVDLHGTDGRHDLTIHRDAALTHQIPLVGLYAGATWAFNGTATDADGSWPLPERTVSTAPLPALFPHVTVRVAELDAMAPGWTLMPVTAPFVAGYLAAFDAEGEVAWWYTLAEPRALEITPTVRGTLLFMWDYRELREIDWLGRTVRSVTSGLAREQTVPVAADSVHHELFEDAAGRWITLTGENVPHDAYPIDYRDPLVVDAVTVSHEPILAIDPTTGAIVDSWDPQAVLDPLRLAYDSLDFYNGAFDWAHTNAVADTGDGLLVSLRHQDAILKLRKDDGSLAWILANPDNWSPAWAALRLQPVGDVTWPYHQHAVKWDDGRVLMFDNRNYEASPWTDQRKVPYSVSSSRIVEYTVDESAGTVAETFSFAPEPRVFSDKMGDADWLPNGNLLGTWAYVLYEGGVSMAELGRGAPSSRVIEVQRDGTVVFDLDLWGDADDPETPAWHTYRAERVLPPR